MRAVALAVGLALVGVTAAADPDHAAIAERALDAHILPGFERFAADAAALAETTRGACAGAATVEAVESAYGAAFDAWMGVSHLRFGPAEEDGTVFAIAFWPDTRGATPRALGAVIAAEDPVVDDPEAFREVSVAARGLFALDYLLFDPAAPPLAPGGYRCRLVAAVAGDLAQTAGALRDRWLDPWAGLLTTAGAAENPLWFAPDEATRALYGALSEGLQATIDLRLGRPLGTFEKPEPRRAEAWRSDRSLRNVVLSLEALRDFAAGAFGPELPPEAAAAIDAAFDAALDAAARVGAPLPEAVAAPQSRLRVEFLRTQVERARDAVAVGLGVELGLAAGFNAMDGD